MNAKEFKARFGKEECDFLKLCAAEGVSFKVEISNPRLGPPFAEKLILCPDLASAQRLIHSDMDGAEGLIELAQNLVDVEQSWPFLSEKMPKGDLTPFYVISALAIDAFERDKDFLWDHKHLGPTGS